MQVNDYVEVDSPDSPHHGKTGWLEWIDPTPGMYAPYGVKFKDENGASNFRENELKVIGTFAREGQGKGRFKKGDRVIVTHPSRQGAVGHISAVLPQIGGYHFIEDGRVGAGGVFYKDEDLQPIAQNSALNKEDRPEMLEDENFDPQAVAVSLVYGLFYSESNIFGQDKKLDDVSEVYVVWFCKTLQNWKALVSTNYKDDRYYEVTHNGDKNETYVDRYVKEVNVSINHNTGEMNAIVNDRVSTLDY